MIHELTSKIKQLSFKHQNNKFRYYFINHFRRLIPAFIYEKSLKKKLYKTQNIDLEKIKYRINYYNKLDKLIELKADTPNLTALKLGKRMKVYYFDSYEYIRYFSKNLKMNFLFGDIIHVPEVPSIVKSRPISDDNANSVVLKLGKIRHFRLINDNKRFQDKKNILLSRGKIFQQHRIKFMEMYFNHPLCDVGQINKSDETRFLVNRMTVNEHLDYKFILCLEGNDVASNLKWVMSSNSIAVMPTPKYETWFMEGLLIPDYHYIHIKDDYSDLEEKLRFYIENTDKALEITTNAHHFVDQFRNKKQEDLISLMVIQKYFEKTNQLN